LQGVAGALRPGGSAVRQNGTDLLRDFRRQQVEEIADQVTGRKSFDECQRVLFGLRRHGHLETVDLGSLRTRAYAPRSERKQAYRDGEKCGREPGTGARVTHDSLLDMSVQRLPSRGETARSLRHHQCKLLNKSRYTAMIKHGRA
jgi:hypothetical protein